MNAPSPRSREEGLRRLYRITAWVAAGAVAATGVIAAVAADALPGRASSGPASTLPSQGGSGDPSTTTTVTPPDGSSDLNGLQPPAQAPSPTRRSHHVVSGGT